jgi:hypothetical protein
MNDYLVLSRGKWDPKLSPEEIQAAIDRFYDWYEGLLAEGRIRPGQRLATDGKVVSRNGITDGPYVESREVIGGYWLIVAASLDEAAALASRNPTIACRLEFEVRPVDPRRGSAFEITNETPRS